MKRNLGAMEKMFYNYKSTIMLYAQIRGKINAERLKTVLRKLQDRHPMMKVTINLDEAGQPMFITNNHLEIPYKLITNTSVETWVQTAEKELTRPFKIEQELLWKVVALTSSHDFKISEEFELLVFADHCLADGMSFMFLLRDLLEILSNPDKEVIPLGDFPAVDDMLPPEIINQIQKIEQRSHEITDIQSEVTSTIPQPIEDTKIPSRESQKLGLIPWTMNSEIYGKFRDRCKLEGITQYSGLCTALLLAFDRDPPRINIPVDIRNYLKQDVGESIGFYISSINLGLKVRQVKRFWKMAQKFNSRLKQNLKIAQLFNWFLLEKSAYAKAIKSVLKNDPLTTFWVSNLGSLKIPVIYGDYEVTSMRFAFPNYQELGVTINSVKDQLFLTISFPFMVYSKETINGKIKNLTEILQSAIEIPNE
ncbi:hypothetical protein NEF87_002218 [Candidatus Lokiarchaeum ossiferum]|uniref:Condensation domain-containing protein n=1 Tax=Candidatus Lokiarchaeum ossiferum TaxID=2951803 RepID=A0ABY6HRG4_9ARCH|nr:hypothetical protein NEF87_002218 [Candidatus Lokiarchaeum sp. B-35]